MNLKNNVLKKDVTTEIKSHAFVINEKVSNDLIKGIFQEIASCPAKCFGDKRSNFLNF